MKFKTRMINAAVAAALGTVAGAAQAVHLGNDGQGQVLIYPYYTMQTKVNLVGQPGTPGVVGAFDTYLTIVNSDSVNGKAVKVRFLEGKHSAEVLDFNLYLSPNDMWTGAVTRGPNGDPILSTSDNSCMPGFGTPAAGGTTTVRNLGESWGNQLNPVTIKTQPFVNYQYLGDLVKDDTLMRAREGYAEVILMADLVPGLLNAAGFDTFAAALHNQNTGIPGGIIPGVDCAGIASEWALSTAGTHYFGPVGVVQVGAESGVALPTSGLSGTGTVLNVAEGSDMSYDAVALESFSNDLTHHKTPGDPLPNLTNSSPQVSNVFTDRSWIFTSWAGLGGGVPHPVSAVLMRNTVINEYGVASQPVGLGSDWVVTFPTKRLHFLAGGALKAPFTSTLGVSGACEQVSLTSFNREERVKTTGAPISPPPPQSGDSICWEVNVFSLKGGLNGIESNALGSLSGIRKSPAPAMVDNFGWLRMTFPEVMTAPAGSTITTGYEVPFINPIVLGTPFQGTTAYNGLPVVGFMDQTYLDNGGLKNYGTAYIHRYTRSIVTPRPPIILLAPQ